VMSNNTSAKVMSFNSTATIALTATLSFVCLLCLCFVTLTIVKKNQDATRLKDWISEDAGGEVTVIRSHPSKDYLYPRWSIKLRHENPLL
jgi:hypothetical protein